MSKLKVDEIRQSTRSVSDSANITLANDGNVSLSGTLSAGTIGDNVTMSNKYYRSAELANDTVLSGETYINTQSSAGNPFFVTGDGDTTNIEYHSTNSNIRLLRAGVYIISWQVSFYYTGTTYSRACQATIKIGSSVNPTQTVSYVLDQIVSTQNNDDYGSGTALWIGHCNANTYVRFVARAFDNSTASIQAGSRYNIALIRPT